MAWTKADVGRIRQTLDGFWLRHCVDDDVAFESALPGLMVTMLRAWAANRSAAAEGDRRSADNARNPTPGAWSPGPDFADRMEASAARLEREARRYRALADRVERDGLPPEIRDGGWRRR